VWLSGGGVGCPGREGGTRDAGTAFMSVRGGALAPSFSLSPLSLPPLFASPDKGHFA